MNTEIIIQSSLFPSYPNEEDDINPGRFGKSLGEYVKSLLEKGGIQVADLYPTDYGYELRIDQFDFKVYVTTGNIDGEENRFLIFIEPKKEYVRKLFKKIPTASVIEQVYNLIIDDMKANKEIEIKS